MIAERIEQGGRKLAELIEAYKDKLFMAVFYAEWCTPCRRLLNEVLPAVAKLAGKGVVICPIDVDKTENHVTSRKHKTMNVPATLFFRGGEEVGRISGMVEPKAFLHEMRIHQKKKANA